MGEISWELGLGLHQYVELIPSWMGGVQIKLIIMIIIIIILNKQQGDLSVFL